MFVGSFSSPIRSLLEVKIFILLKQKSLFKFLD